METLSLCIAGWLQINPSSHLHLWIVVLLLLLLLLDGPRFHQFPCLFPLSPKYSCHLRFPFNFLSKPLPFLIDCSLLLRLLHRPSSNKLHCPLFSRGNSLLHRLCRIWRGRLTLFLRLLLLFQLPLLFIPPSSGSSHANALYPRYLSHRRLIILHPHRRPMTKNHHTLPSPPSSLPSYSVNSFLFALQEHLLHPPSSPLSPPTTKHSFLSYSFL
jgi:hypothetical protein